MTGATICKLAAVVIGGVALVIIGGVVAAEAWAAWESRRYRRRPEADPPEIPDDPRERMVPRAWRKHNDE